MSPLARFQLVSPPPTGRSAIAVIHITGDVSGVLRGIGSGPVAPGRVGLRDLGGIDRAVVARWSDSTAMLMPHASPLVVSELLDRLSAIGCRAVELEPRESFPEAASEIEARMLRALARATSPLAIDLLLDQPRRWASAGANAARDPAIIARSRLLNRLLTPPTVVALGRPNIGKSTLLNALAGRAAAVVADMPGTTRDHVGVTLDLAGVVVRWIDTPGLEVSASSDPIQEQAQLLARRVATAADLIMLCADATGDPPEPPTGLPVLTVGLRRDLGPARVPTEVNVAAECGGGVGELVGTIRERLVPDSAVRDGGPWMFWGEGGF